MYLITLDSPQFLDHLVKHLIRGCWSRMAEKEVLKSEEFYINFWYPPITYCWTVSLILDHSYLVGNLTNSKIAETKALEPLKI
jgi:hypothetical protein